MDGFSPKYVCASFTLLGKRKCEGIMKTMISEFQKGGMNKKGKYFPLPAP